MKKLAMPKKLPTPKTGKLSPMSAGKIRAKVNSALSTSNY